MQNAIPRTCKSHILPLRSPAGRPINNDHALLANVHSSLMQNAARDGFLDEPIFRRANISLAMLSGTTLFLIAATFIPNPIYPSSPLLPKAALALGAINLNQLWVSGINFVKYSPEGFNTLNIFKVESVVCVHMVPRQSSLQDSAAGFAHAGRVHVAASVCVCPATGLVAYSVVKHCAAIA